MGPGHLGPSLVTEAYQAWVAHLRNDCEACDSGTPESGDEDYVCPEGQRLKAAWLAE